MTFKEIDGGIRMTNFTHFHIDQILECGQCFRFWRLGHMHYALVAFGRVLYVRQYADAVEFCYAGSAPEMAEFQEIWLPYFDLRRDYGAIAAKITKGDPVMQAAVNFAPGIRILRQEPWEMLISFIISANNRIPQIMNVIKNISARYGTQIDAQNYAFPDAKQLARASLEDLRALKTGFRDRYIVDAAHKAAAGALDMNRDTQLSTEDLRKSLMGVHGVGEKVAHCILLFGYGRTDAFPVDTWVRKVMRQYYFNGEAASAAQIHNLARERFGEYSGFAQQYLFHYIRSEKSKEKPRKT
jgi:N-glycosylase/DNA lyase